MFFQLIVAKKNKRKKKNGKDAAGKVIILTE
jgi:hypothetical protein